MSESEALAPLNGPEALQSLPEERILQVAATVAQRHLQDALNRVTPKARQFLKLRLLYGTDAEARHVYGYRRKDGDPDIPCGCSRKTPGWVDFREATLLRWKRDPVFRAVYDAALSEPLIYAGTRLEMLAPVAVQTYEDLLDPSADVRPSVRRLAARDILEASGLKRGDGQQQASSAVQDSIAFRIARARLSSGQDLSSGQRELLESAGIEVPRLVAGGPTMRTLDGEDVPLEPPEAHLPD